MSIGGREKQARRRMRNLLLERDDRCCARCGNRFTKKEAAESGFDFLVVGVWELDNLVLTHSRRCPTPSPGRIRAGLVPKRPRLIVAELSPEPGWSPSAEDF